MHEQGISTNILNPQNIEDNGSTYLHNACLSSDRSKRPGICMYKWAPGQGIAAGDLFASIFVDFRLVKEIRKQLIETNKT